jgi:hypothetical protein
MRREHFAVKMQGRKSMQLKFIGKQDRIFLGRTVGQVILLIATVGAVPLMGFYIMYWHELPDAVEESHLTPIAFTAVMILILISTILYWLRENLRIVYGLIEIAAAIALMYVGIIQAGDYTIQYYYTLFSLPLEDRKVQFLAAPTGLPTALQLATAVYVFVRGLDNIGQSLTPDARLRGVWQWLSLRSNR